MLQLFCEIDNTIIKVLATKCEKFINSLSAEEEGQDEDIDSNQELEAMHLNQEEDEYNLLSGTGKRMKKYKNRTKTDYKFFLKFIIVLLCIHAYYL